MEKIKLAVHTALRDDSVTTVGLRTLLGHAAAPFGVYYHHFPESPDFSTLSYLTWFIINRLSSDTHSGIDIRMRELVITVTAWSEDSDTRDQVLRRVENVLHNKRRVTNPTSESELHDIQFDGAGPDLFDTDYQVHYRSENYHVWYRDDVTV